MHHRELNQVWAELTAPGARFEIADTVVRGVNTRTFRNAPPSIRTFWLSTAQFADRDYIVYQGECITYREAQRSGMAADLLGLCLGGHCRCRHERVVGRRRDRLRAQGLPAKSGVLR